ncbi:aromatic compound dioxygenase [Xylariaceae sp. FL0255]|nr:aromatic compound dioxygenase [Xylariaceae sp. FL0255]
MMRLSNLITTALAAIIVTVHPSHDEGAEMAARKEAMESADTVQRYIRHCQSKLRASGYVDRQAAWLHEIARTARLARVEGEYVRSHIGEGQQEAPMLIYAKILERETCEPPSAYCNTTGKSVPVNDDGSSTLKETWLRGIQHTGGGGIVTYDSIFCRHYTKRATHIHIFVHNNVTMLSNRTPFLQTGYHVGQMFLDQDLISQIEAAYPCTSNTTEQTSDSFMDHVLLRDNIENGVLAWMSFGINTTNIHTVSPNAKYLSGGGVTMPWHTATDISMSACTLG